MKKLLDALSSLKLAVGVIFALLVAMIVATVMESMHDTPTAQYYVYRSLWFKGVLAMLGANIFFVMVSRWPWKPRHAAFLLAHTGILLLLFGSWLTDRFGVDGTLRVNEGQTSSRVEIQNPQLVISDGAKVEVVPVPWHPPGARFRPISVPKYGLSVDEYYSHADVESTFVKAPPESRAYPAAKILVVGGFMRIRQEYWLWGGDPTTSVVHAGPAVFGFKPIPLEGPGPKFELRPEGEALSFWGRNSEGKVTQGKVELGKPIDPGWKGGVTVTVQEWIPRAVNQIKYSPAKIQYGDMAPPSAIHVFAGARKETEVWLGLGDRAALTFDGKEISIAYLPQRFMLPFGLRLDRFTVERYEGTVDPSSYASNVTVFDQGAPGERGVQHHISMNEPLSHMGLSVYQASYEDAQPRPTVSIFSVNRDPGRAWKYWGSILLVLGSILLFANKWKKAKTT